MFANTLEPNTKKVLALLAKQEFTKKFYLAGGTALALQLGHRQSIDLDFFTREKFDTQELMSGLSGAGKFSVEQEKINTLSGNLDGVKISFFWYEPDLLENTEDFKGVDLASPVDIGLMKLTAIASRGSRKDFIDLYKICQDVTSLPELLDLAPKKFSKVEYQPYYLIKSLTYFIEAEQEPMPIMLVDIDWEEIKEFFKKEAPKLV